MRERGRGYGGFLGGRLRGRDETCVGDTECDMRDRELWHSMAFGRENIRMIMIHCL